MKRILFLILSFILILALPALALEPGTATVTASALNFRDAPDMSGEVIGLASEGTAVEVLEDLGEWCRVRWNGQEGYMASEYLAQEEPAPAPVQEPAAEPAAGAEAEEAPGTEEPAWPRTGVLTGDSVRFRAGPSLEDDIYGYFDSGARVTVLGLEEDWYQVEYGGRVGYVFAKYIYLPTETKTVSSDGSLADAIIQLAKANLGVPYCYGGASPNGFDCSGLVYYCYSQNGVTLERTATAQYNGGVALSSQAELLPGDLVFFATPGTRSIGHVGIFIGDREFIHASSGSMKIMIDSLDASYWVTNYYGACRVLN